MKGILKIIYNFICKIIIKLLPLLRILRLQTLVIDHLSKIRLGSNKYGSIQKVISELPLKRKLIALDAGAQGGFNGENFFLKKYEKFFDPILVEPITSEAERLKKKYTNVIDKALWNTNCTIVDLEVHTLELLCFVSILLQSSISKSLFHNSKFRSLLR